MASKMLDIYCIDGLRKGRMYFFTPEQLDAEQQFQINAIMPSASPFEPSYYAGLIYKVVPAGFGVWHGVFVRKAERA